VTHSEPEPAAARAATAAAREDQIAKQTDVERRTDRARGLMLGLALGESTGLGRHQSGSPTINAGVATQLAAFTLEGYIRAAVRFSHRGICHPPSVIWRAYCRWGIGQGIDGLHASAMPGSGGDRSGWLCHVPALRERRGDAPRTVAALLGGRQGTIAEPLNSSMGWHGLVRTLPLIVGHWRDLRFDPSLTRDVTALTHGSPLALDVSSAAVAIGASLQRGDDVLDGLRTGTDAVRDLGMDPRLTEACDRAIADAVSGAPSERDGGDTASESLRVETLRAVAPDATAWSALLGALIVVATHPKPGQFVDALELAVQAPEGAAVASVTGALLGAAHGASALPVDLVSRHELAWALDTLTRDAVAQLTDSPGGSEYVEARDERWNRRCPGY